MKGCPEDSRQPFLFIAKREANVSVTEEGILRHYVPLNDQCHGLITIKNTIHSPRFWVLSVNNLMIYIKQYYKIAGNALKICRYRESPYICMCVFHSIRFKVNKRLEYSGTPFLFYAPLYPCRQ